VAVNPKRESVQGLSCFPDVASLPGVPDAGLIAVPGRAAIEAVRALGETGLQGGDHVHRRLRRGGTRRGRAQERLVADRRAGIGMRLLGPNCLGLFNDAIGFYPIFSSSFESGWPWRGASASPASPAPMARTCIRWRATA
jgi:acyl-CoA synthetase (NDP forming)